MSKEWVYAFTKNVLADWSNKQKNQSNQDTNNIQTHAICKHKNTKPKK